MTGGQRLWVLAFAGLLIGVLQNAVTVKTRIKIPNRRHSLSSNGNVAESSAGRTPLAVARDLKRLAEELVSLRKRRAWPRRPLLRLPCRHEARGASLAQAAARAQARRAIRTGPHRKRDAAPPSNRDYSDGVSDGVSAGVSAGGMASAGGASGAALSSLPPPHWLADRPTRAIDAAAAINRNLRMMNLSPRLHAPIISGRDVFLAREQAN